MRVKTGRGIVFDRILWADHPVHRSFENPRTGSRIDWDCNRIRPRAGPLPGFRPGDSVYLGKICTTFCVRWNNSGCPANVCCLIKRRCEPVGMTFFYFSDMYACLKDSKVIENIDSGQVTSILLKIAVGNNRDYIIVEMR